MEQLEKPSKVWEKNLHKISRESYAYGLLTKE